MWQVISNYLIWRINNIYPKYKAIDKEVNHMSWLALGKQVSGAHHEFLDAITLLNADLRDKHGVCGEWSPKQVMAHVVGWDRLAVDGLALFAIGDGDKFDANVVIDEFNAQSVASRALFSWDETIKDLQITHQELQDIIEVLQVKGLKSDGGFGQWMLGRKQDYIYHTGQIQAWL